MVSILLLVLPFFTVIAAGLVAGRVNYYDNQFAPALTGFVFRVAMPVALFSVTIRIPVLTLDDVTLASVYLATALTHMAVAYAIARRAFRLVRPDAGVHALATTLGNAVFLGLPIAQSVEGWSKPFVIMMMAEGIVVITVGALLIAARVDETQTALRTPLVEILKRPFQNPLVIGSLSGFLLAMAGIKPPEALLNIVDLLGRAAGPTALFALGLFLSRLRVGSSAVDWRAIAHIAISKLIVLPLGLYFVMRAAGLDDPGILGPAILFTAVPVGVVVFLQADARQRYQETTVVALALTTLLAFASIILVLYAFR